MCCLSLAFRSLAWRPVLPCADPTCCKQWSPTWSHQTQSCVGWPVAPSASCWQAWKHTGGSRWRQCSSWQTSYVRRSESCAAYSGTSQTVSASWHVHKPVALYISFLTGEPEREFLRVCLCMCVCVSCRCVCPPEVIQVLHVIRFTEVKAPQTDDKHKVKKSLRKQGACAQPKPEQCTHRKGCALVLHWCVTGYVRWAQAHAMHACVGLGLRTGTAMVLNKVRALSSGTGMAADFGQTLLALVRTGRQALRIT